MDLESLPIDGLLAGKRALVTGGAKGIGRAVSLRLAQAGADVAVTDLREADAAGTAHEVERLGRRALALGGDVSKDEDRRSIVDRAEKALGPIDVLVNNAGIMQVVEPLAMTEADWDRMLGVNAKAVFFMSQLVLKGMVERKSGSIVSLASAAGKVATSVNFVHYNVSKAAVIAMTKTLSQAFAGQGVRVNCVCPGIIDTDMWAQIDREQGQQRMGMAERELFTKRLEAVPMGRAGTPDDVAKVILFLASPLAGYMTGQAVNVTGGWITF